MTERSPFLSAGWGRYQTRGLSFANYDGSSLPREPMGARIGLGSAPSGECRLIYSSGEYGGRKSSEILPGSARSLQRWLGAPSRTKRISCLANFRDRAVRKT